MLAVFSFGGIANRKHFEIDIVEKRVDVFLSNHQFDSSLFLVASQIIYNIYDIIKDNQNENLNSLLNCISNSNLNTITFFKHSMND
jgi:hypothetical protein